MTNHDRKEPPLQAIVKHIARHKTSIYYYVSMALFALTIGITIAGVFDA